MKIKLQIYILCRDRPQFSEEAISTVLESAGELAEVIVSDNSEGDTIQDLVERAFPRVCYRRRFPTLTAIEHFKKVVSESTAEYLVMFHDDDRMRKEYVSEMLSIMEQNSEISAVGCDCEVINETGGLTGKRYIGNHPKVLQYINDSHILISAYLSASRIGAPPFPGYCYRRMYINSDMLNFAHGGKHSDVSLLLKVLHSAPMMWYRKPLIEYREHSTNDSKVESVPDRLSLLRYLFHTENIDRRSPDVIAYKFQYWLTWWRQQRQDRAVLRIPKGRIEKIVFKFLAATSIKWAFTEIFFWKALLRKLLINKRQ